MQQSVNSMYIMKMKFIKCYNDT